MPRSRYMRSDWRLGRWRGVPISLHWSVFLGLAWFYYRTTDFVDTAIAFTAFVFLLLAHELGHAAMAQWRRVEVLGIELFVLHGACWHEETNDELDDVLIAWGGVMAQLAVFALALGADLFFTTSPYAYSVMSPLLGVLIETNLVVMIVNLIPVAPLDGAKAWRIFILLGHWAKKTLRASRTSTRSARLKKVRKPTIDAEPEQVVVDILDKLKKRKSDG